MKSKVLIQEADYSAVPMVIQKIFQEFPLEVKNKLVWVKPNMLTDTSPEKSVTTHPSIIKAVVNYLLKGGARVVVGDNGGARTYGANERAAQRSGIIEASYGCYKNIGVEVESAFLYLPHQEEVTISKIVRECDIMISIPKLKTHLATILTAGIKNSYGILAGSSKMDLHRKFPSFEAFSAVVAEVYNLRKPDLLILDGVVCMEGDGPNCTSLRKGNFIMASNDAVSMDVIAAKILGADIKYIPMITYAAAKKMGVADFPEIEIIGEIKRLADFVLPRTYGKQNAKATLKERLIYHICTTERLKVSRVKCISCGKCYENCPVGAIKMKDKAFIDQKRCILCYCCKEICPVHAVEFTSAYGIMQKVYQKLFSK